MRESTIPNNLYKTENYHDNFSLKCPSMFLIERFNPYLTLFCSYHTLQCLCIHNLHITIFIAVGVEPDMLHFSKDCNTIVVANEGTPYATSTDIVDPEGAISIITLSSPTPSVTTLNFTSFNER